MSKIKQVELEDRDSDEYFEHFNEECDDIDVDGWEWRAGDLLAIMYTHKEVNQKELRERMDKWFIDNPRYECPDCGDNHESAEEAFKCCQVDA